MRNQNLKNRIKKEFNRQGSYVILTLMDPIQYNIMETMFLDYFSNQKNIPGVYITINKPAMVIKNNCKKEKIDVETIIFIDAVTKISGGQVERSSKTLYLDNPENLTDLGISVSEAMSALPKDEKFILFDSINTLLVYNSPDSVIKFIHFLTSRMRQWNVKGIIFSLDKSMDSKAVLQISQFCDKVVDLTK